MVAIVRRSNVTILYLPEQNSTVFSCSGRHKEIIMRFFSLFFLVFLGIQNAQSNSLNTDTPTFLPKQANQQLDQINLQLSVQNLDVNNLNKAINTLSKLSIGADECIDDAQKKLSGIDALIKQGHASADTNTKSADLVYLTNEQKKLADNQAQCRLFTIRANEAISAYKTAVTQLKQEAALERGTPLWSVVSDIIKLPPDSNLITTPEMTMPPILHSLLAWGIFIFSTLLASTFLIIKIRKSRFAHRYLRLEKSRLSYITLISCCLMVSILLTYLFIYSDNLEPGNPLLASVQLIFFYFFILLFVVFIFKIKKVKTFFSWYALNVPYFKSFILFFLSLYLLMMVEELLSKTIQINPLLKQLNQSVYLLTIITAGIYFIYRFCRVHQSIHFIKHHHKLLQRTCTILLLMCAIAEILGYHALATRLTYSGLITFAISFITILAFQGINKTYLVLNHNQTIKSNIIKHFGYKDDQVFMEFLILKATFQLIIIVISLFLITHNWAFATAYIESVSTQFINGIHFANLTFYPTRIICGVIVFCLLYLLFRAISTAISRRQQFEEEEETQVAIASIFTYLGFGLAIIAGLLVAGFDFTGLAIVAGALSVGIGLGLQSIVNNFVSGLILLIEKPIKPGDRIMVDGIEGTVKKISVRSTLIITPAREDIIIPNSDLITRRVTNYMYSDRYLSIHCEVTVAYGSDINLVRDLLLNVANDHDEVIKNNRNKPYVLFSSFGEKTLVFQVWCLIKDANKKTSVQSELNFAIHKLFHEHQIYCI